MKLLHRTRSDDSKGFGGYVQEPAVIRLYADVVRIYVRDVPAFRDDSAITEKRNRCAV